MTFVLLEKGRYEIKKRNKNLPVWVMAESREKSQHARPQKTSECLLLCKVVE